MLDYFRELEQQGKRVEWHPKGYIVRDYENGWSYGYWGHRWGHGYCGIEGTASCPFPEPYSISDWPVYYHEVPWWKRVLNQFLGYIRKE